MADERRRLMNVLITGGFGYVGGRLAQALGSHTRHRVLLGSRRTIESPAWLPQASVVQMTWNEPIGLKQICKGLDAIVHLAGMNAQECEADPLAALEFNALATGRLLDAAVEQRVGRFIYASTAHVYGNALAGVVTEETCARSIRPYAASHRAGEDFVRAASARGNIEAVAIRLSNAFGAPVHKNVDCWSLVINDLCRQAVVQRQMVLRSTGQQRRDFVPLTDVCGAIIHLLEIEHLDTDLMNVGGEWAPTVWEVACLVQKRCSETLAFRPQLTRQHPQGDESAAALEYRVDLLRRTGFQPSADKNVEVDRLLEFCRTSFDEWC